MRLIWGFKKKLKKRSLIPCEDERRSWVGNLLWRKNIWEEKLSLKKRTWSLVDIFIWTSFSARKFRDLSFQKKLWNFFEFIQKIWSFIFGSARKNSHLRLTFTFSLKSSWFQFFLKKFFGVHFWTEKKSKKILSYIFFQDEIHLCNWNSFISDR